MWANQTDQKGSENGVNADDAGEEGAGKDQEDGQANHGLGRSVLDTPVPPQDPDERGADGVDQEEDVGHGGQENVQGGDAAARIDERYTQRQQDPADDIVSDPGGQDDDADLILQQVEFRQDATQDRKGLRSGQHRPSRSDEGRVCHPTVMAMATPTNSM